MCAIALSLLCLHLCEYWVQYSTMPCEISCKISWFWPVYVKLEGIICKIVIAVLLMECCGLQHANLHQTKSWPKPQSNMLGMQTQMHNFIETSVLKSVKQTTTET